MALQQGRVLRRLGILPRVEPVPRLERLVAIAEFDHPHEPEFFAVDVDRAIGGDGHVSLGHLQLDRLLLPAGRAHHRNPGFVHQAPLLIHMEHAVARVPEALGGLDFEEPGALNRQIERIAGGTETARLENRVQTLGAHKNALDGPLACVEHRLDHRVRLGGERQHRRGLIHDRPKERLVPLEPGRVDVGQVIGGHMEPVLLRDGPGQDWIDASIHRLPRWSSVGQGRGASNPCAIGPGEGP